MKTPCSYEEREKEESFLFGMGISLDLLNI
jgi:hypothetical protein